MIPAILIKGICNLLKPYADFTPQQVRQALASINAVPPTTTATLTELAVRMDVKRDTLSRFVKRNNISAVGLRGGGEERGIKIYNIAEVESLYNRRLGHGE